jgi:hypothetical protein
MKQPQSLTTSFESFSDLLERCSTFDTIVTFFMCQEYFSEIYE